MPLYELAMTSSTGDRHFLFEVQSVLGGGWVDLQLVSIVDKTQDGTTVTERNPSFVYPPSNYFGSPWKARQLKIDGDRQLCLMNAFGNPGSRLLLQEV